MNSFQISGREMFTFNPDMARDDDFEDGDEAFDTANLPNDDDEEEGEEKIVVLSCSLVFLCFLRKIHIGIL